MESTMDTRVIRKEAWMQQAACVGRGDLFFADHMRTIVRQAKRICSACAVKHECLAYALEGDEIGVWGGMTANERRKLKRATKKQLDLAK